MDNALLEREQSILDMQAWRGVFQARADAGDGEAIVIKEPRDVTAVLTPVDAKELVGSTESPGPGRVRNSLDAVPGRRPP